MTFTCICQGCFDFFYWDCLGSILRVKRTSTFFSEKTNWNCLYSDSTQKKNQESSSGSGLFKNLNSSYSSEIQVVVAIQLLLFRSETVDNCRYITSSSAFNFSKNCISVPAPHINGIENMVPNSLPQK